MSQYKLQTTTIWRFPNRGDWATHNPSYRGNWSPHVPRNIILKYSSQKDVVLDLFVGSGTTLIETKLLGRVGIGIDINPNAIETAKKNLKFNCDFISQKQSLILGNSTNIPFVDPCTIDLICTHPPYANIIKYSEGIIGDLSLLSVDAFLGEMRSIAHECHRILKPKKHCCILIGDIRRKGNIIPLGFEVMNIFIQHGFQLNDIIIKEQFNCKRTRYWENITTPFHLITHEYVLIFKK